ncbi:MAG: phosphate ABC transporter permease [Desulfobacteraceae bacterium A6]|nr:MAG: phosphate ABC transporter permease [Desulfobacteraceae bacterium A6]
MNEGQIQEIIIEPKGKLAGFQFRELWNYRELLRFLVVRDIKVRYKQTVLGGLWAILQPFMNMVVFTIFFGHLAKIPSDGLPYPIFVYTALLPWQFFSGGIGNSGNSLVANSHLISKVYFPRLIIPAASLGAGCLDFLIAFGMLILMMVYYGIYPGLGIFLFPFLMVLVAVAALGVGMILAALNVAYRDFRYVIPFLIQFWLFATPVIYPASLVPEKWRWLINLNPMAGLITGIRSSLLNLPISWTDIWISGTISIGLFVIGIVYFKKMERRFADII